MTIIVLNADGRGENEKDRFGDDVNLFVFRFNVFDTCYRNSLSDTGGH